PSALVPGRRAPLPAPGPGHRDQRARRGRGGGGRGHRAPRGGRDAGTAHRSARRPGLPRGCGDRRRRDARGRAASRRGGRGARARDAAEGPGCEASSLPASSVTPRGAVLFVWPALKEPLYGDADAAPWRDALARVRAGRAPDAGPRSEPRSEAALFLAADLTLLRAAAGGGDYESAAT